MADKEVERWSNILVSANWYIQQHEGLRDLAIQKLGELGVEQEEILRLNEVDLRRK